MDEHGWNERYRGAREAGQDAGLWATQPHQQLREIAGRLSLGTAVDLATGDGRNAIWLADRGWDVTAVDFSAEGLDIARERAEANGLSIDWRLGDANQWAPGREFDLVTITYLHLDEAANIAVIRRASQWVSPGGTLLVIGHDKENLTRGTGGPPDETLLYSPEMLRAATPLKVVAAERIVRNTSTDPEGPQDTGTTAIDTLLHAVND
ncbi:class I SAM-dependent methyltransferase [Arthrobacter castelli]|uniref:class I SAM-dependent methyltransferase n=1 Tax=Arthrobacter castelli TaxID=271431 RepID=UPI00040B8159|nr:class I SAM-dependent methyltransferase [Arthrobacter castelli]